MLNDGKWAWPAGLAHYIEAHLIALPDGFLADVRANGHVMPAEDPLRHIGGTLSLEEWIMWARNRDAVV